MLFRSPLVLGAVFLLGITCLAALMMPVVFPSKRAAQGNQQTALPTSPAPKPAASEKPNAEWYHDMLKYEAELKKRQQERENAPPPNPAVRQENRGAVGISRPYIENDEDRKKDALKRLDSEDPQEAWNAAEMLGEFIIAADPEAIEAAKIRSQNLPEDVRYSPIASLLLSFDEAVFQDALRRAFQDRSFKNRKQYLLLLAKMTHPKFLSRDCKPPESLLIDDASKIVKRKIETSIAFLTDYLKKQEEPAEKQVVQSTLERLKD